MSVLDGLAIATNDTGAKKSCITINSYDSNIYITVKLSGGNASHIEDLHKNLSFTITVTSMNLLTEFDKFVPFESRLRDDKIN